MSTLDELLVEIGIDAGDLTAGTDGAADDVERSLAGVGDAADAMGRDIVDAADQASTALGDVGASADEAAQGAEQAAADVEGSFKNIAAAAAGAAVGALFVSGLTSAMDASTANVKLTNQLGLTAEESERAGVIAGEVFTAGFSDSIGGVNEALAGVTANIGGMGKATDAELAQMTKSALALADTFNFDVSEATQAMGTLIKTGLAKDGTEALDLLTATAQKLPPALQEELPTLTREYGEFFDQMGFTGPQMMGLLAQAAQNPTFELDKLGDAMKEFTLLMADTDAVSEPLKELKLDVTDIQKLMNEGRGTEAFDKVTGALKDVEDQTRRTKLQAALFGGPGEDMGNSLLNLHATGSDAAAGLDEAAGASKNLASSVEESKTFDAAWRQVSSTLGESLAPALEKVGSFMAEHPELIKILVPTVLLLAAGLGIAAAAQWAMNSAMLANPYTWVVVAIVALVVAILSLWANWESVTKDMGRAWDWTTDKFGAGWSWLVKNVFNPIGHFFTTTIPDWVGDGVGWITGKWNSMINWFAGVPGRLARGASGMWSFVSQGLKGALNSAIGLVNDGIWFINDKLIGNANRIPGVSIPWIPYIPFLAEGGITTGPTLAMIGEGREQEAVLPLSKLDSLLRSTAPNVARVEPAEKHLVLELRGGSRAFREFFQETVRTTAGGDVVKFAEG